MAGEIRITTERRKEPDIGLYVLALIALARELAAEESVRQVVPALAADTKPKAVRHD